MGEVYEVLLATAFSAVGLLPLFWWLWYRDVRWLRSPEGRRASARVRDRRITELERELGFEPLPGR